MVSKARQLHQQAAEAREKENFLDSLKLIDEAGILYSETDDLSGLAEALADRSITLKLISQLQKNTNFLILAKHTAMAGLEIAQRSGDKSSLAIPYLNVAKIQEELNEIDSAIESYKKAVKNITKNPPASNTRPGVIADFKIHLATCEYGNGDKSALDQALSVISDLEASNEDSYNKNVWLSGGYMHLAAAAKSDNLIEAKEYLQKAKEIIDSDSRLKIRLSQWEKLAQTIR